MPIFINKYTLKLEQTIKGKFVAYIDVANLGHSVKEMFVRIDDVLIEMKDLPINALRWFVSLTQGGKSVVACLHQARAIDYRRLSSKLGQIDTDDYSRVQEGFALLYIKNIPHSFKRGRG